VPAQVSSLFEVLHGRGRPADRFTEWCASVKALPRRQTRVLTWPIVTVFLFIAQPDRHVFLKPNVTRVAAAAYGFDFKYEPRPNWQTTANFWRWPRRFGAISETCGRAT
jgi:hypothetical protein